MDVDKIAEDDEESTTETESEQSARRGRSVNRTKRVVAPRSSQVMKSKTQGKMQILSTAGSLNFLHKLQNQQHQIQQHQIQQHQNRSFLCIHMG